MPDDARAVLEKLATKARKRLLQHDAGIREAEMNRDGHRRFAREMQQEEARWWLGTFSAELRRLEAGAEGE